MSKLSTVRPKALKPTLSDEKRRTVKPNSADNLSSKKTPNYRPCQMKISPAKAALPLNRVTEKDCGPKKFDESPNIM